MDYRTRAARWLLGVSAHPGGTALTGHLLERMSLAPGSRVLDVACGGGSTLTLLRARGHDPVGIDRQPGTRRAITADAHALPFAAGSFAAVVCECSLSTFERPEGALAEIHRVLRPGGVLGLTDVVLDRDRADAVVLAAVDRLTRAQTLPAYAALVTAAGLQVVDQEDRASDAAALLRRLRRRLPFVRSVRACAEAVQSGALGYGLVIARKVS